MDNIVHIDNVQYEKFKNIDWETSSLANKYTDQLKYL